jgi:hypothetical protein
MNYDFVDDGKSVSVNAGGVVDTLPKNQYLIRTTDIINQNKVLYIDSVSTDENLYTIDLNVDTITGVGAGSTTADQLKTALTPIFFLDSSGGGGGQVDAQGFIDYNDTTGVINLVADTWTNIPNNGQGAFTNKAFAPDGVTELMDVATGAIDTTGLELGDTIIIRNDYTINPNTNNSLLEFRYGLGGNGGEYTLSTTLGRLDDGSGKDYRFSLKPDLIYMGDENTRTNPITLQVKLSTNGTLVNAGSVIQVIKRKV